MDIKQLRNLIRQEFGPTEVREGKTRITLTFPGGFASAAAAEAAVHFFLRNNNLNYFADAVNDVRVYLIPTTTAPTFDLPDIEFGERDTDEDFDDLDNDLDLEVEDFDGFDGDLSADDHIDEVLRELRDAIAATTEAAHEQNTLKSLQRKELDFEVDQFITGNLSAALELLPTSRHTCTLDEVKNLLAFAFLTGKWSNARMADIELLAEYFNDKFKFQAEQFGNG